LLSSPDVSDMLPSVSDAAVLEDEVVGRRIVDDAEGRVGALLKAPPNAVRDVVAGVFAEASGDRVVPDVGLAAVEPPIRFGAADVDADARFTGGTFSAPFFGATGEAAGEDSAGVSSDASIAGEVLS
jgi:hypothetical protein